MTQIQRATFGGELWTTHELLDRIKQQCNVTSNYAVANLLDVAVQTVDRYSKNLSHPNEEICERIATLLHEPPEYIIACIQVERSRSASAKKWWEAISRKLAAPAMVAAALFIVPELLPDYGNASAEQFDLRIHYATLAALWFALYLFAFVYAFDDERASSAAFFSRGSKHTSGGMFVYIRRLARAHGWREHRTHSVRLLRHP